MSPTAANAICLPSGEMTGRTTPSTCRGTVDVKSRDAVDVRSRDVDVRSREVDVRREARRAAEEKRKAERRPLWTERRRPRHDQELREVEVRVREETEPRQVFAAEPVATPRIRLFDLD